MEHAPILQRRRQRINTDGFAALALAQELPGPRLDLLQGGPEGRPLVRAQHVERVAERSRGEEPGGLDAVEELLALATELEAAGTMVDLRALPYKPAPRYAFLRNERRGRPVAIEHRGRGRRADGASSTRELYKVELRQRYAEYAYPLGRAPPSIQEYGSHKSYLVHCS